jgi:glyoxylase-like metal-dependent hydrolase (beta-lactamase superfamily II)
MTPSDVLTIDTHYAGLPQCAAAFLLCDGPRAAFVETNTTHAVPRLLEALEAAGRRADDVELVIITHAHLDHAGGASALMEACPHATLLAHPKAAANIIDPERLVRSAKEVYGEEAFEQLYGEIRPIAESRVRALDDAEIVSLGSRRLTFFHTRGHANHHFCIHDAGSNGVFTGDSFGIAYPALQDEGLFTFPTTTPTDFDASEYQASLHRIVDTGCERVFLTHFGEHVEVEAMARSLHDQLDQYGALVDELDASRLEGDALDGESARRVGELFELLLRDRRTPLGAEPRRLLDFDRDLNAQGIAFAVKKRRFKREQGR